VAVEAFLARQIDFLAIADLVEATLAANPGLTTSQRGNVDDVLAIDAEARTSARSLLTRFASAARAG
jgi:1-deoxy-D-xylulose-5-phosphate reductoisomerase